MAVLDSIGFLGAVGSVVAIDVLMATAANALNQADRAIMPIASIPMARELKWSMMQQGWVLSSFAFGYICSMLPAGWVSTRFHPFRLLLVVVFIWSTCTILTPAAARSTFSMLFVCRVCMGIAEGFCLPAIFQMFTQQIPSAVRNQAFALMLGGGQLGVVIALSVCPRMTSWDSMFALFGGAGLMWCFCCATRLTWGPGSVLPDAEDERVAESIMNGDAIPQGTTATEPATPWRQLCTSPALWAICLAHFAQNWTGYLLASWFPTYLHEVLGMPTEQLWIMGFPFLVNAVAGVLFANFADSYSALGKSNCLMVRRAATATALLGPAAAYVLIATARTPAAALGAGTLSYFFAAASCSGYLANHADISTKYAGLTFAIANTVATVPGLTVGPLTAYMVEQANGQWWPVFSLAAGINVVAAAAYVRGASTHRIA